MTLKAAAYCSIYQKEYLIMYNGFEPTIAQTATDLSPCLGGGDKMTISKFQIHDTMAKTVNILKNLELDAFLVSGDVLNYYYNKMVEKELDKNGDMERKFMTMVKEAVEVLCRDNTDNMVSRIGFGVLRDACDYINEYKHADTCPKCHKTCSVPYQEVEGDQRLSDILTDNIHQWDCKNCGTTYFQHREEYTYLNVSANFLGWLVNGENIYVPLNSPTRCPEEGCNRIRTYTEYGLSCLYH